MNTILVTGRSGFIRSNFIQYLLKNYQDIHVVNFDALTYAGNPENLSAAAKDSRYTFVKGNIGMARTIEWYLENQKWLKRITSGEYLDYDTGIYQDSDGSCLCCGK